MSLRFQVMLCFMFGSVACLCCKHLRTHTGTSVRVKEPCCFPLHSVPRPSRSPQDIVKAGMCSEVPHGCEEAFYAAFLEGRPLPEAGAHNRKRGTVAAGAGAGAGMELDGEEVHGFYPSAARQQRGRAAGAAGTGARGRGRGRGRGPLMHVKSASLISLQGALSPLLPHGF